MSSSSFPTCGESRIIFREETSPGVFEEKPPGFFKLSKVQLDPTTDWFTWYSVILGYVPPGWQILSISVGDIVRWSYRDNLCHGRKVGLSCFNLLHKEKLPIVITGKFLSKR
jgi:hypothetical protein